MNFAPLTSRAGMTTAGAALRGVLYLAIALCAAVALCPVSAEIKAWAAGAALLLVSLRAFIDGSWQDAKTNEAQAKQAQANADANPLPPQTQKVLAQVEAYLPILQGLMAKEDKKLQPAAPVSVILPAPLAETEIAPPADPALSEAVLLAAGVINHAVPTEVLERGAARDGTPVLTSAAPSVAVSAPDAPTGAVNE